jgi:hypothetical protein
MADLSGLASGLLQGAQAFSGAMRDREKLALQEAILKRQQGREELQDEKARLDIQKARQELAQGPKPTESEVKTAQNLQKLRSGEQILSELEASGYDPTKITGDGFLDKAKSAIEVYGLMPASFQSPERKQYETARNLMSEGLLRQATGANAPTSEDLKYVKTYTPQPGDSPEVLAMKREAREREGSAFEQLGGSAVKRLQASGTATSAPPRKPVTPGLPSGSAQAADPQRQAAMDWLNKNPNDPRAQKIREKLGL